jgi:hypothetical protein
VSSLDGGRTTFRQKLAHVLGYAVIDKRYDNIESPGQPHTLTLSTTLTGRKWEGYGKAKRDLDRRRELWNMRIKNGPAATIIDAYENAAFTNGWKIESDNPDLAERITKRLNRMHAELDVRKAFADGLSFGYGIAEKARVQGADFYTHMALVTRCSRDFDLVTNSSGFLVAIRQYDPAGKIVAEVPAGQAFVLMPMLTSEGFGKSLLEQCYDPLMWWDMISRASADAIWRHGHPIYNVEVQGVDGKLAPMDVMTGMEGVTNDLNPRSELVTSALAQIKELGVNGIPQVNAYLEWALMNICASSSVPEELFGLGKGNTGLLAVSKWGIFYDKVAAIHHCCEPQIDAQIIDPLCIEEGAAVGDAHWVFNNPNSQNDLEKIQFVKALKDLDQIDPIVDNAWIRDYLGVKQSEAARPYQEDEQHEQTG